MSPPDRRPLWIVPLGSLGRDDGLLDRLADDLDERFRTRARRAHPLPVEEAWADPSGRQIRSDAALDHLMLELEPGTDEGWFLALTRRDLTAPDREYVFGEATITGHWALVGLFRLREGLAPDDREGFYARLLKEAVHELGHLAGLPHCPDSRCAMHPSATPPDIDPKGADFCPACLQALDRLSLSE